MKFSGIYYLHITNKTKSEKDHFPNSRFDTQNGSFLLTFLFLFESICSVGEEDDLIFLLQLLLQESQPRQVEADRVLQQENRRSEHSTKFWP